MNFARFLGSLGLAAASAGAAPRAAAFSALAAAFASLAVFATSSFSTRLERKSDTFCLASANDVPVKMSRPIAARPASITKAPYGDTTLESGPAPIAPMMPPASPRPAARLVSSSGANTPGLPRDDREPCPAHPTVSRPNPMNIRTRSSGATSRSRTKPQNTPITGIATASRPNPLCSRPVIAWPMGPARSNQTDRTARPANTTSAIPTASRANGDRICRVDARAGFFLAGLLGRRLLLRRGLPTAGGSLTGCGRARRGASRRRGSLRRHSP